jgi:hypothetical protein
MLGEHCVDAFKVFRHVSEGLAAGGALVRCLDILLVAFVVDAVSAGLIFVEIKT